MQTTRSLVCCAPRAHLFTRAASHRRNFTSLPRRLAEKSSNTSPFGGFGGPSPLRLPKEEQELFEELQRQSTGAFSTPRSPPQINQSPDSSATDRVQAESLVSDRAEKLSGQRETNLQQDFKKVIDAKGKGEELHPNVRRGATPEFEGETNPKTGEVGGPKNEPLRWGAAGEWSYNGRTTDF